MNTSCPRVVTVGVNGLTAKAMPVLKMAWIVASVDLSLGKTMLATVAVLVGARLLPGTIPVFPH